MDSLQKTISHNDWEMWAARPDLSYVPAKPRLSPEEQMFTRIVFLRPHPQHALAFEEVMKEAAALRKKHGIGDASMAWQLAAGADGPAYALLISGKNEADFYAHSEATLEKMGADWQALSAKGGPMLRELSYSSTVLRPDLAYSP